MKTGNTREPLHERQSTITPQWSPVMKTGNTGTPVMMAYETFGASMEPGHEDREYALKKLCPLICSKPQWSPVMKTGNTWSRPDRTMRHIFASMEPGHEDREYSASVNSFTYALAASMEPGHEDREYADPDFIVIVGSVPQWSPVMKTGNTIWSGDSIIEFHKASMEPGHEDREYRGGGHGRPPPV